MLLWLFNCFLLEVCGSVLCPEASNEGDFERLRILWEAADGLFLRMFFLDEAFLANLEWPGGK